MSNNLAAISKLEKNPKEIYEEARRLLIKIADNILRNPQNEKLRILQKENATISLKVLGAYGGLDCLLLMGFQDNETFLKLPIGAPLKNVEQMRDDILQCKGPSNSKEVVSAKSDEPSRGAVSKHSRLTLSTRTLEDDSEGATENDHFLSFDDTFDFDAVLIDHVKERPPLWNTALPASQRTEEIQSALWQEVSDALKSLGCGWEIPDVKKRWQLICKIYETSDVLSLAEKSLWKYSIEKCKFLITEEMNEFVCRDERLMQASEDVPKQLSALQKSECMVENAVNPLCIRLSEILDELPLVKRAKLEVEFLAMAYDSLLSEREREQEQAAQTEQAVRDAPQVEPLQEEDVVKRVILPRFHSSFVNPFLRDIALRFHLAQMHDDKTLQERARKLIPLQDLEESAQSRLRAFQEAIKKDKQELEISLQDMLILELLSWFKHSFFSWVDSPPCEQCAGQTRFSHMCTDRNMLVYTDRIEMHRCDQCDCLTPFARYNDLNILMETRRGRCGEWANTFTLFCRALGWDARHIFDETDHVWTEVYSFAQKRWLHCDPCENACDTPLMYESGWKKQVSYVTAYSGEEVQDVTWRYSSQHKLVMQRRNKCGEDELIAALISLRQERQKNLSDARRKYLTKRLLDELVELMVERQPNEKDQQGRVSGSVAWRTSRGELQESRHFVWKLTDVDAQNSELVVIQYSAALDRYERGTIPSAQMNQTLNGWSVGVFESTGIFRKEERDWKIAYLSRQEGVTEGRVTWKFTVESAQRSFDVIQIYFDHALFENGNVAVVVSDEYLKTVPFDHGAKSLKTCDFTGSKTITISAVLTGGRGDVAWQHAQLFRQSMNSEEYPFKVLFTFRKDV